MSYEFRNPVFNFTGVLSAGCTAVDTTLSSQAFAQLPVISGGSNYTPLVIANDAAGKEEIVWITGHTTASNSVTVVRAREGTTAQTFVPGDVVRCTLTLRDTLSTATSAAMPSSPHYGMRVEQTDTNAVVEYGPNGWAQAAPLQAASNRRHHWNQTGAALANGATVTCSGMSVYANSTGSIATYSAGVVTLNKPGLWSLTFFVYCPGNTNQGGIGVTMSWPNGAFLFQPWQYVARSPLSGAGGNVLVTLTWAGYVTSAQAQAGISLQATQTNAAAVALTGLNYDFSAEFLGG